MEWKVIYLQSPSLLCREGARFGNYGFKTENQLRKPFSWDLSSLKSIFLKANRSELCPETIRWETIFLYYYELRLVPLFELREWFR